MECLDISGSWRYETDEQNTGVRERYFSRRLEKEGFILPGSACDNKVGTPQRQYDVMDKDTVRAPRERYEYVGVLWLQREIVIPSRLAGKDLTLFFERVNIASSLWVDAKQIGRQIVELSAPHCYRLPDGLPEGVHTITLRVDNTDLFHLDKMASGYSVDTQGYWNGVIGKMELRFAEPVHIEDLQIYPVRTERGGSVRIKAVTASTVRSPLDYSAAKLTLEVTDREGISLGVREYEIVHLTSKQVTYAEYPMGEAFRGWSEYDPYLYTVTARLFAAPVHKLAQRKQFANEEQEFVDEKRQTFGMRFAESRDKRFYVNGTETFLRGTTNCAIYPLTGYPPMEIEDWRRQFRVIREYGLNYMRFHAWCPPEAAFAAADELGVYVSVEMPLWLNLDVCASETGDDAAQKYYYQQEALEISRRYGNHPSFLLFSCGNELLGDFEMLDAIITSVKAYDGRRLYTLTSNFDHKVLPCEDYLCAYEAGGHPVRIQNIQDEAAVATTVHYGAAVRDVPVPVVSFEIGQYCVYPDVDRTVDYTGNLLPVNLSVIGAEMRKKGVYGRLREYVKASGDLAAKLYKEDIEAALRTEGFGGFGLLSLCDYTGQCTATVGILDVFYKSKGILSAADFREFCGEAVPLFLTKRIYSNEETLHARLAFYDYRAKREPMPEYHLTIYRQKEIFYQTVTRENEVEIPLAAIEGAAMLCVELRVCGYKNRWRIYVYPGHREERELPLVHSREQLERLMEAGGRAVVTADALKGPIAGNYIPVFWSPAFFPTDEACGAVICNSHPVFRFFPTERYPDYQWKRLLEQSKGADISGFPETFAPLVEPVPNFFDNTRRSPLFEGRLGKADLLFCGFDLKAQDLASIHFREILADYVASADFAPTQELPREAFLKLFS